jgi:DNA repair protein RecO (recombination protein O)
MSTIRTSGIVLQKKEIRENDRLYVVYTNDLGKIEAVARGSRKILSKLAPHLEPPIFSDLMIAKGKQLDKIAGADTIKTYPKIRADLARTQVVFSVLNQLNRLTKFNSHDPKIWALLVKFLEICENIVDNIFIEKKEILENAFLIKFLSFLGYKPELKKCVFCGKENLSEKWYFDFLKGGIFCAECLNKNSYPDSRQNPVSVLFLEEMNFLLYKKFDEILESSLKNMSKETKEMVSSLIENYRV